MIVVTAIYGDYDTLKPHPEHEGVAEWRCYTDDPALADNPKGWNVQVVQLPYEHPRLSAKWWKCHPPLGLDVLWIDGAVEVVNPDFIDEVAKCLTVAPLTMWRHPWRDCIYDEVGASAPMTKYVGLPLGRQVGHYQSLGWPAHNGLWASTVMGWAAMSAGARQMGAAWFAHCEAFTYQDQLSLPVLLERYGIKPEPLPSAYVDRRHVIWHGHRSDL